MTEAKAREIVAQAERGDPVKNYQHESFCEAKGYLEAIEKAEGLAEALKENLPPLHKIGDHLSCKECRMYEELAKWEKEK